MNESLKNFLHAFPEIYNNIEVLQREESSFQTHPYRSGEKLPKFHEYDVFIDSDGSRFGPGDLDKTFVDYDTILFMNFQGWSLDCESNQFPLFSSMFTSAKNTYQLYDKKGLWSLMRYDGTTMAEESSKQGNFLDIDFDVVVCRGNAARQFNNYKNANAASIVTLQALWERNLPGTVFDNTYLMKAPSAYLSHSFTKNIENVKRQNFIMYASTVDDMNNQKSFARLIDPSIFKDKTILFCGKVADKKYAEEVTKILNDKGVKHIFLGMVPHHILSYLYLMSRVIVRYATKDYGPRCISEGLWAGLPFVVNSNIIMPDEFMRFGISCKNGDADQLNDAMIKSLSADSHAEIHNYCKKNITLSKTYSKFLHDVSGVFANGQH